MNGPRRAVVCAALAAILLLALAVCALHRVNAVSLRGTARASDYTPLARAPLDAKLDAAFGGEAWVLRGYTDGVRGCALFMEEPEAEGGLLIIRGGLLRLDQPVGEVRVRVGLIPVAPPRALPRRGRTKSCY